MSDSLFCDAQHDNVPLGCYGKPNHEGKHWAWGHAVLDDSEAVADDYYPFDRKFWWEDGPVTFTKAELGILLTTLEPVKQFFPELKEKLEKAQAALQ